MTDVFERPAAQPDAPTMAEIPLLQRSDRWRPTRAGLISLWRYWDETFTFHDGRLLLRGPNGSGKSMALELLLPFLLDANASPDRLTSAAKSRGGLFDRIMTGAEDATRAGFAWVEFRSGTDIFTVGARMRASNSTRKVDLDFFTTSQAVGTDLHLLDSARVPLSRKGLIEAIGPHGRVHASGDQHRNAVRETLYPGFGPDRYASVITALLALRKEKLSQNLDLDKLSEVLSEALPALDDHDLAAVAEGFERLDRRRAELAALEAEQEAVAALATRQRNYARAVLASVAVDVRLAESRRDGVTRHEREAIEQLDQAVAELTEVQAEQQELDARLSHMDTELEALKSSEAYAAGAQLDDQRRQASHLRQLVDRDRRLRDQREGDLKENRRRLREATQHADDATTSRTRAAEELGRAAADVGAEAVVSTASDLAVPSDLEELEALVRAWVNDRRSKIVELRRALDAHRTAVQQRGFYEGRVSDHTTTVEKYAVNRTTAEALALIAAQEYATDVADWIRSLVAIEPTRLAPLLALLTTEPSVVEAAVAAVGSDLSAEQAVAHEALLRRRNEADAEIAVLQEERIRFAEGSLVEPDVPAWRTDRSERLGAPLWRLVDLDSHVQAADADGLEAALTASGLIDAWISPDGTVDFAEKRADLSLGVVPPDDPIAVETSEADLGRGWSPPAGPTLADLLVPLADGDVPTEVVRAALASVAVVDSVMSLTDKLPSVAIGRDGTFRLGAAGGRGPMRPASLLGSAAQERRRLARLADLDASIARMQDTIRYLAREGEALERDAATRRAEIEARPSGESLSAANRALQDATTRLSEVEIVLADSRRSLVAAEDQVRQLLRELSTLASKYRLPTEPSGLNDVEAALGRLELGTAVLRSRVADAARALAASQQTTRDVDRCQQQMAEALEILDESERMADVAATRLATLESTVGAEFEHTLRRIESVGLARDTSRSRARVLQEQRPQRDRLIGGLESSVQQAAAEREQADHFRLSAHQRFVHAIRDGFSFDGGLKAIDADALDGITATLAAARAVATELEGVSCASADINNASARLDERLHDTRAKLGGRVDLHRELSEHDWWLLHSMSAGIRRSVRELATALTRELDNGRQEFAADEERLFEQVLAGSVRRALASRIRLANQLVDGINRQLSAVRTAAAGVEVRLKWEVAPDQHEAVKAARALLLRDPADLSATETAALQAFVRARVDQARSEMEANAPWEARLRETLDYRSWHRFSLQLGHRDWEGLQPATARRLQRLSTGERSIALHLPMLASIAAHYAGEDGQPSRCPRLILLDELFAGVDTANRAQLFGTFTAWQLDAVFTSDHEWCQYATLNGIAIHFLHAPEGSEPVTSTRFTWDGRQRSLDHGLQ